MGDSGDRVGDTCWACCRLASVLRDRGLTTAGRCCGEELGVLIPTKEKGAGDRQPQHNPAACGRSCLWSNLGWGSEEGDHS